jgi:hypothetical protein
MRKRRRVKGRSGRGGETRKRIEEQLRRRGGRKRGVGRGGLQREGDRYAVKVSRGGKRVRGSGQSAAYTLQKSLIQKGRDKKLLAPSFLQTTLSRDGRQRGRRVEVEVKGRKERIGHCSGRGSSTHREGRQRRKDVGTEIKKVIGRREEVEKGEVGRRKEKEAEEWEEERVRVGTGYRVRRGARPKRRTFEVGYGDRKKYIRPEGVEAELGKTNTGRKVKSKGKGARERVMKVVCTREGMRKRSEYTGCGRTRKSRVGKKKLKPTKVRAR